MGKEMVKIKHPVTNREATISKVACDILEAKGKITRQKMQAVNEKLTHKYYEGQTNDIRVALKFKETGEVDDLANPMLELKGKLETLDGQTRQIVEDALYQFMLAINGALADKTKDGEEQVTKILTETA